MICLITIKVMNIFTSDFNMQRGKLRRLSFSEILVLVFKDKKNNKQMIKRKM